MCAQNICFWKHPVLWVKWKYHIYKWNKSHKPEDWLNSWGDENHPC